MYINLRYIMNIYSDMFSLSIYHYVLYLIDRLHSDIIPKQCRITNIMLSLFRWFRSKFSGRRLKEILMRALEGGYVPRTADVFVMYWRHRILKSKGGVR